MKYQYHIGLDIAKDSIDYCVLQAGKVLAQGKIRNNLQGYKQLQKQAKELKISLKAALICLEHTGIYSQGVVKWLSQSGHQVWQEASLAIKRSMGLTRGKSDRIDAQRIALYAYRFEDQHVLWEAPRQEVSELQQLLGMRNRLLGAINALKVPLEEGKRDLDKRVVKSSVSAIKSLEAELSRIEKQIEEHIQADARLSSQHKIISSVEGVGKVLSRELLVITNEFKRFMVC